MNGLEHKTSMLTISSDGVERNTGGNIRRSGSAVRATPGSHHPALDVVTINTTVWSTAICQIRTCASLLVRCILPSIPSKIVMTRLSAAMKSTRICRFRQGRAAAIFTTCQQASAKAKRTCGKIPTWAGAPNLSLMDRDTVGATIRAWRSRLSRIYLLHLRARLHYPRGLSLQCPESRKIPFLLI
ncbi:hypothetical protein EDB81DRAFT_430732 [Dactylonectria macrodidyma]|uniref:Uncharacterized protein n=1 Tax=Dactylonectria macrodidyma TaxID=307937 RepID=A0A9P9CY19_9HYPO|nr:hypothetical protein EDB81DRAFT_430732 [Dactylonectria macrodidyma]